MPFRDNKGHTPYIVAPDKDTRNVFRKYMGENPERYDYKKAQVKIKLISCISVNVSTYVLIFEPSRLLMYLYIFVLWKVPGPLTEEMESKQLEKKKAQNALKKQREKKLREEKRQQELEAEEKRRFASLSDREKVSCLMSNF